MHTWVRLTERTGRSKTNPSEGDLLAALTELFSSNRDNEHPDCWIECGTEDGPLHTVSIFQSGYAVYTKYSDSDMSEELESKRIEVKSPEESLQLWLRLLKDDVFRY